MTRPTVSVLIAAWNAETTLADAVRSALAQGEIDVEVIVVDDCSSDRTVSIAAGFPTDRVRVLALTENHGPGAARNAGLAAARGEWVAVLDADDTMLPGRLAAMIARAEASSSAIVVDNLKVVHEGQTPEVMFDPTFFGRIGEIDLANFIASNILFEATFSYGYLKPVFRRSFLAEHQLRYNENLRIGEDYIFFASALACGAKCVVEPNAGYNYFIREGSISRVLELRHVEAMLAADRAFVRDHELDAAARTAQARRTRSLEQAASFLMLVDHIKAGAPLKAVAAALRDPAALRHLRMPIAARLRRLAPLRTGS